MRKDYEALVYGEYEPVLKNDEELFAFRRRGEKETTLTMLNFSDKPKSIPSKINHLEGKAELLLSNYPAEDNELAGGAVFQPYEARLYLIG